MVSSNVYGGTHMSMATSTLSGAHPLPFLSCSPPSHGLVRTRSDAGGGTAHRVAAATPASHLAACRGRRQRSRPHREGAGGGGPAWPRAHRRRPRPHLAGRTHQAAAAPPRSAGAWGGGFPASPRGRRGRRWPWPHLAGRAHEAAMARPGRARTGGGGDGGPAAGDGGGDGQEN